MNEPSTSKDESGISRRPVSWQRLAQKELRETLRDRRTIVTLIAMPLIVYPILSIVFKSLLLSTLPGMGGEDDLIRFRIAVITDLSERQTQATLLAVFEQWERKHPRRASGSESPESAAKVDTLPGEFDDIASFSEQEIRFFGEGATTSAEILHDFDSVIELHGPEELGNESQLDVNIVYPTRDGRPNLAARYMQAQFDEFNLVSLERQLSNVSNQFPDASIRSLPPLSVSDQGVKIEQDDGSNTLASIIPLILVLMTITGAVYPAIDLTAGERERGTLETLIAAPIPRRRVLVAKMLAVISVAILTATLNVVGMAVTIWAFQLDSILFGEAGLSFGIVAKIFGLLALFATFFAAVLLFITSFARSFKEAQAYLIPVILLSIAPGLITMSPGMKLEGPLAVCPMVNLLLLSRDIMSNQVEWVPAAIAVFSTLVYVALAIAAAASVFGADSILYGGQSGWRELFSRPLRTVPFAPVNVALVCLFLLLPINFVSIGLLGRLSQYLGENKGELINVQLLAMGCFTVVAFFVFPFAIASHQRIRLSSGFGWLWPRFQFIILGLALGLTSWPIVMGMIDGWYEVLSLFYGEDVTKGWQDRLSQFCEDQASSFRGANPVVIAIAFSILPALCEEWFFRGLLQRSLLAKLKPWRAILISALTFGVFHTLSGSIASFDRLLPSSMMGLVLGLIAYRSNSILPGIILHSVHNASIAFIAYYLPALNEVSWFPATAEEIPRSWMVVSAICLGLGILSLIAVPRSKPPAANDPLKWRLDGQSSSSS